MDEGLNLQNHCAGSRAFSTGPTAALRWLQEEGSTAKVVGHQDFLLCLGSMAERWLVSLRKGGHSWHLAGPHPLVAKLSTDLEHCAQQPL